MDAVTVTARMTASEFLAVPEDATGRRWQLIDGELVMNEPSWAHGGAQLAVAAALRAWTRGAPKRGRARPPVDIQIDERNVFAPDVVWYRESRVPSSDDRAPYPMPDIAVEIRSPSTWRLDIGAKKTRYESHGVAELWLVDTAADVVLVFRRSTPKSPQFDVSLELTVADTLTSPLLPGFALPVGEIFAD
jgi:Uma2 family endonuclease